MGRAYFPEAAKRPRNPFLGCDQQAYDGFVALAQTILVVDDEPTISQVVASYLRRDGFHAVTAADGPSAVEAALEHRPDLVVLDVMLPGFDGLQVMARLRQERHVPVILLTARGEESDRVVGLRLGADDYVVKPFSPAELVARVHAVLRRVQLGGDAGDGEGPIAFGNVVVDARERSVAVAGESVELTAKEFDLLLHLARHLGQVHTRDQLMDAVWRYPFYTDTATVTVHVRRVRQKIEADPLKPRHLVTVWGVGYKLTA
jgi:two-component system response regulator ResD